jgi:7-cyano-7-deazaguanine synthase
MRAVSLVSGGLDSTVATSLAARSGTVELGLVFRYGQRAADREVEAAGRVCSALGVPLRVIETPWLGEGGGCALLEGGPPLPTPRDVDLDGRAAADTADAVWVPNRNGVFGNNAAAFAEPLGASLVVTGFNAEEARTFPDNSREFLDAASRALSFSTRAAVRVESPVSGMRKEEIVRIGHEIGAPIGDVWPCYDGGAVACGACESCRRFRRALEGAGLRSCYKGVFGAGETEGA